MYTIDYIFPVIPIKHLVKQDGKPTTLHKLATRKKYSVSNPHVLLCQCVLRKTTAHVDTKVLNMRQQAQKGLWGMFVGIPQHKKDYSSTYLVHQKYFLHMTLYLAKKI